MHVRTLPGLAAIARGEVKIEDISEIEVDDLLGRDAVPPDHALLEWTRESESALNDRTILPVLASVTDQAHLEQVCNALGVQTIYHAAAYKHVPMVERNPIEAINNNIFGTWRAAMSSCSIWASRCASWTWRAV